MTGLYPGVSVYDLVPGDAGAIDGLAQRLAAVSDGLNSAAQSLRAIGSESWKGVAASAFQEAVGQQPERYGAAGGAFGEASVAIRTYGSALSTAQTLARQAISTFDEAEATTSAWKSQRAAKPTLSTSWSQDPGAAGRARAETLLADARAELDLAAARLCGALNSAQQSAPRAAGLFQRVVSAAVNLASPRTAWVGSEVFVKFEDVLDWASGGSFFNDLRDVKGVLKDAGHVGLLDVLSAGDDTVNFVSNVSSGHFASAGFSAGHVVVDVVSVVQPEVGLFVGAFYAGEGIGNIANRELHISENSSESIASSAQQRLYGSDLGSESFVNVPTQQVNKSLQEADEFSQRYDGPKGFARFVWDDGASVTDSAKGFLSEVL